MKTTMRFEGGAELAKALDALSIRVTKSVVRDALVQGGEPIRVTAGHKAPRGDPAAPNLGDSMAISTARPRESGDIAAVAIGPTRHTYYGLFQELGTTRHGAKPFMRPAFDSEQAQALDIIRRVLWTSLASRGISRTVTQPNAFGGGSLV